jgi:3-deoxy-D-manno-octulosonic-acid transferase
MQSELDASRALELGADPARVTVTGNTKFDSLPSGAGPAGRALAGELGLIGADELLVAGSTHPGEEAVALEAYLRVRRKHPEARLLIAPRHIERAAEVARLVSARGLPVALRTRGRPEAGSVIVLDTIGELGEAYGLGAAAFVGKSLVGSGGHNVLEPAALGKPVFFGPRMENFRDIADIVRAAGVGFEVHSAAELAEGWERALGDAGFRAEVAGKAAKMMADSVGAARRSASIVLEALGRGQR